MVLENFNKNLGRMPNFFQKRILKAPLKKHCNACVPDHISQMVTSVKAACHIIEEVRFTIPSSFESISRWGQLFWFPFYGASNPRLLCTLTNTACIGLEVKLPPLNVASKSNSTDPCQTFHLFSNFTFIFIAYHKHPTKKS